MRLLRKTSLLAAVLLIAASCAKKPLIEDVPDGIYSKIQANNQITCSYKGRILIDYEDDEEDVKFKGLLNKQCDGTFVLKILGPFAKVYYDITYSKGHLVVFQDGKDISDEAGIFARRSGVDKIISTIRLPLFVPDDSFTARVGNDGYILEREGVVVRVDREFRISSISSVNASYEYEYDDGQIASLTYSTGARKLRVKFL